MTRRRRTPLLALAAPVVALLLSGGLTGCTAHGFDADSSHGRVTTSAPDAVVTVIDSDDSAIRSLETSKALFDGSPLVVVASADDPAAQLLAAQASVELGVPLLLARAGAPSNGAALSKEIGRLDAHTVVAVGDLDPFELSGAHRVDVAATADALEAATGIAVVDAPSAAPVAAVAALPVAVSASSDGGAATIGGRPSPAPALAKAVAVSSDADGDLAAAATARAAGVAVEVLPAGVTDILSSSELIEKLSAVAASSTLLLGAVFSQQPSPEWSVRSAESGVQLAGGGQRLFGAHRFVAIYGAPGAPVLGVLGEQGVAETIARAQALAAPYSALSDVPIVPTLEIIATVAAGDPGDDGDYSNELDPERLRPYIEAAEAAHVYVVLDLQPGRSDFFSQAKQYQALLEYPNVGLALDPEWRLAADQVPLEQIGAVSAAEVDSVSRWLADLIDTESLPPKIFVLHQFRQSMLPDRAAIDRSRPELEFLVHVDGQGAQPEKQATWKSLHDGAPAGIAWGWKNFFDEDAPMLTPEQTMTTVSPVPDFVSYQ